MIKVLDYTPQNVNRKIVDKLKDALEETKADIIDFKGVNILELVHKDIAELMVNYGVKLINIAEVVDRDIIEYHKKLLLRPQVDNIEEYIEIFKKRFPVGTACILDRTIKKGLINQENRESLIMITDILEDRVRVRKYHHSKVQPKFFRDAGGKDSKSLYAISEINFIDLYNDEIVIDHPRTEHEKFIIDTLFAID